jgi:hypothetical protein
MGNGDEFLRDAQIRTGVKIEMPPCCPWCKSQEFVVEKVEARFISMVNGEPFVRREANSVTGRDVRVFCADCKEEILPEDVR